jgi:hypothetical protein
MAGELLAERLATVRRRIADAAESVGRDPDGVDLLAVTKGWGTDAAEAALALGLTRLGENRVQEAEPKIASLPAAEWHLIGPLQSNKVRRAVSAFAVLEAVDSFRLLDRINAACHDLGVSRTVMLEVNVANDPAKHGFAGAELTEALVGGQLAECLDRSSSIRLAGLMTVAPLVSDPRDAQPAFAGLRVLRDRLEDGLGRALPVLSMGMSADLEIAVAEGATLVRLGTALFGPRSV